MKQPEDGSQRKLFIDFNNDFTLFTAVPVLFNMYTDKDSNLISDIHITLNGTASHLSL